MADQPIPQQEVDPVRGLVEALTESLPRCADGAPHRCGRLGGEYPGDDRPCCRARAALSTYRAWEEGGGSDSEAAPGRSGDQGSPFAGLDYAASCRLSVVFNRACDLRDDQDRRINEHLKWLLSNVNQIAPPSGAALEAAGVDGADTLSDPIPSPPASAPPEGMPRHPQCRETGSKFCPQCGYRRCLAAPPPPAGVDRPEREGAPRHFDPLLAIIFAAEPGRTGVHDFLNAWLIGELSEWPEYLAWVEAQS